jgi:hypothetical protein
MLPSFRTEASYKTASPSTAYPIPPSSKTIEKHIYLPSGSRFPSNTPWWKSFVDLGTKRKLLALFSPPIKNNVVGVDKKTMFKLTVRPFGAECHLERHPVPRLSTALSTFTHTGLLVFFYRHYSATTFSR